MDSHGNWTNSDGSGSKNNIGTTISNTKNTGTTTSNTNKELTDKGNTSDTKDSISDTTSNKTNEIKYAEEARFSMDGNYAVRRGGYIKVRKGVAKRWQGKWKILETTHTIDSRGYSTEGTVGRIPYVEDNSGSDSSGSGSSNGGSSGNGNGNGNGNNNNPSNNDSSGGTWVMDPDGTWHKKAK